MRKLLAAVGLLGGLWASNVTATILYYDVTVTSDNWESTNPRPFGVASQPTFSGTLQLDNTKTDAAAVVGFNMVTGSQTWTKSLLASSQTPEATTFVNFNSVGNLNSLILTFTESFTESSRKMVISTQGGTSLSEIAPSTIQAMSCRLCASFALTPPPPPSAYTLLRNSISVFDDTGGWTGFTANYDVPTMSSVVDGVPAEGSKGIGATFTPNLGYSLSAAAEALGYDHFNWIQWATVPDGSLPTFIDPPLGCYEYLGYLLGEPCKDQLGNPIPANQNRDLLPYYLDEEFSLGGTRIYDSSGQRVNSGQTRLEQWTADAQTLLFSDSPNANASFHTCLVGVRVDGTATVFGEESSRLNSTCFDWVHTGFDNLLPNTEEGGGTAGSSRFLGFRTGGFTLEEEILFARYGIDIVTMPAQVPEPPSILLVLLALGLLAFSRSLGRVAARVASGHVAQEAISG